MLKTMKYGFLIAVSSAIIAGCASTSETEEAPAEEPAAAEPVEVVIEAPEPTPAETEVASEEVAPAPVVEPVEELVFLETVFYFDFDQSTLRPEARTELLAHAARLKADPRPIRLEGHGDERGTREYNIALGERRAIAVRNFLRFEGVVSPIEVVSYGEERPASFTSDENGWALNRRVELK